jgi:hypothetical protein
MSILTPFVFLLYFIIVLVFGIVSLTLYYHVDRYSYIGDASKRVFITYLFLGSLILLLGLILIITNHLAS